MGLRHVFEACQSCVWTDRKKPLVAVSSTVLGSRFLTKSLAQTVCNGRLLTIRGVAVLECRAHGSAELLC